MVNGSQIQKNGSENDRNLSLFSSSECIAWLTVFITESAAIVALNILTIIVFVRNRSLRKRSLYFVINLAVADMLVGGFSEVVHWVIFGSWECSLWLCIVCYSDIWGVMISRILELFLYASLTNLVAISLERMHATFRPFKHRVIKNWVLRVVIAVTWVTAALLITAMELMLQNSLYLSYTYVWCSFISIFLFVIFVSYTSIAVKVYCGAHPLHHGAASRERKLTKTLFIVTLVSLITWLPHIVLLFLHHSSDIIVSLPNLVIARLYNGVTVLVFANSLVNPILYTLRMPEFRRALVSLFRRQQIQAQVQIPLRVIACNKRR